MLKSFQGIPTVFHFNRKEDVFLSYISCHDTASASLVFQDYHAFRYRRFCLSNCSFKEFFIYSSSPVSDIWFISKCSFPKIENSNFIVLLMNSYVDVPMEQLIHVFVDDKSNVFGLSSITPDFTIDLDFACVIPPPPTQTPYRYKPSEIALVLGFVGVVIGVIAISVFVYLARIKNSEISKLQEKLAMIDEVEADMG